ncbi:hypothetical protein ACFV9C_22545 [Kribbella sp. NPDC059898]|uniref:hypothetical protein n=1 Tax=Kribbella sp. NPDC059898 TaxID=3346995 RepID=UPI003657558B
MAADDGSARIEPSSAVYQEFARLYRIAQEQRPGGQDRWNGELQTRNDDKYGGLRPDGAMRLNQELVLDHLTGAPNGDPAGQGQALATVLHESKHARTQMDAPDELNAVRRLESRGLDEGLTELSAMDDFDDFIQRAGYDGVPQPAPEYAGAVSASRELLRRATSSEEERTQLLNSTLDKPVSMRWDAVADHIVRNELADVVPPDPAHQQAARAHLINEMAVDEWSVVADRAPSGELTGDLTVDGVDQAVKDLGEHYQRRPDEPYPAKVPNPHAAVGAQAGAAQQLNQEQERAISTSDLEALPPPAAETRVDVPGRAAASSQARSAGGVGARPSAVQQASRGGQGDPMRFLGAQAPAARATHQKPVLGDGARGAGSAGQAAQRMTPDRGNTPTDRGSR